MSTSILPVGGIIGPIVGGVFVSYWSWRGIMLLAVLIATAMFGISYLGSGQVPLSGARPGARVRGVRHPLIALLPLIRLVPDHHGNW
jgi:MFS family permease